MTFYKISALIACLLFVLSCGNKNAHLDGANGATFYVDKIDSTFTADQLTPNQLVNRKFVNITACLKDNALQTAIMNLQFQISAGSTSATKLTDDRGCLVWQELVSYNPAEDERQIVMSRTITAIEGHSGSEVVQLAYDPWSSNDRLIFLKRESARGVDTGGVTYSAGAEILRRSSSGGDYTTHVDLQAYVTPQTRKGTFISSMTMQFQGRDFDNYRVNNALGLTLAHKYELNFKSSLIRATFDKGVTTQDILGGRFKFFFVLLKEGYTKAVTPQDLAKYVVAANEFESTAYLGRFLGSVSFKFNNVAALASRMTGLLTVISLDQPNIIAESSFEGVVSPMSSGGTQSLDLMPSGLNAKDLLHVFEAQQSQNNIVSGMDYFTKYSGYVSMSKGPAVIEDPLPLLFGSGKTISVDIGDLRQKIKDKLPLASIEASKFGRALCFKYFDQGVGAGAAYNRCKAQPEKMIRATVRDLVEKVNDPKPVALGHLPITTLSVSTVFDFTQSKTASNGKRDTTSKSWGYDIGASIGGSLGISTPNLLNPAGAPGAPGSAEVHASISGSIGGKYSVGHEWYTVNQVDATSRTSNSNSAVRNITVLADGFKFAMDVTTRSCLLVAPTPELEVLLAGKPHPAGKYLCDEQTTSGMRSETYYFLNESAGGSASPLSDNMSADDNPWRMFIRGQGTFDALANFFGQQNTRLILEKMPETEIRSQLSEFYMTQEYPGMLLP